MKYVKSLDEPHCGNCKKFYQHYILTGTGRYVECYCGHCAGSPRKRSLVYHSVACDNYIEKPKPMKCIRKHSRTRYF